jgi:hypothetical protein
MKDELQSISDEFKGMKEELISLVVNNKKVEEGAECALGASSGTWNAFECRFCINLMHSDFFQNLARPSKSPFLLPEGLNSAI